MRVKVDLRLIIRCLLTGPISLVAIHRTCYLAFVVI